MGTDRSSHPLLAAAPGALHPPRGTRSWMKTRVGQKSLGNHLDSPHASALGSQGSRASTSNGNGAACCCRSQHRGILEAQGPGEPAAGICPPCRGTEHPHLVGSASPTSSHGTGAATPHANRAVVTPREPVLIIVPGFALAGLVTEGEHDSVSKPRAAGRGRSRSEKCHRRCRDSAGKAEGLRRKPRRAPSRCAPRPDQRLLHARETRDRGNEQGRPRAPVLITV